MFTIMRSNSFACTIGDVTNGIHLLASQARLYPGLRSGCIFTKLGLLQENGLEEVGIHRKRKFPKRKKRRTSSRKSTGIGYSYHYHYHFHFHHHFLQRHIQHTEESAEVISVKNHASIPSFAFPSTVPASRFHPRHTLHP